MRSVIRETKDYVHAIRRKESDRTKYNRDCKEVERYFQNQVLGFSVHLPPLSEASLAELTHTDF